LVRTGRIDLSQSVTHRVPLDDVNQGLEVLEANQPRVLRVVAVR
jgi:threonine dehydrogenase-like Zn-dependent dehydrogenase